MIPVLHDASNVTRTYGKGKLADTISCVVYEELNGEFSLELQYPVSGPMYSELMSGGVLHVVSPIYWTNPTERVRGDNYFDIYKHSIPIDGVVTFYANHISRRLIDHVYVGTTLPPGNVSISNQIIPALSYEGNVTLDISRDTTGISGNGVDNKDGPQSALAMLVGEGTSYVNAYGGDVFFGCAWVTTQLIPAEHLAVTAYWRKTNRGADNGASIRYGYNMMDIKSEKDDSGTFNAVIPFWDDGAGNKTYATGHIVQPTSPITPVKAAPLDCTDAFETQPTSAELVTYAQNYLNTYKPWIPSDELTVNFANGLDTAEQTIDIGDTVHVYWNDAEVAADLRCVAYSYDVLEERYSEIVLGKQGKNFVAVTGFDGSGGVVGSSVSPYDSNPADLGTASPGTSKEYARGNHVHNMPSYGERTVMNSGSADIDTYTSAGIFYFSNSVTLSHQPSGVANGWLIVLPSATSNYVRQIWERQGIGGNNFYETYTRSRFAGTWTSWVRFSTDNDTEDGSSSITDSNGAAARKYLYKINHIVYFEYQSALRAWSQGDSVCTIPAGFVPTVNTFYLNGMNNFKVANIQVAKTTGIVTVNQLETVTGNSRIYINGWWYV